MLGEEDATSGYENYAIRLLMAIFHTYDSYIASIGELRLQESIDSLVAVVELFERVGIWTTTTYMTCLLGRAGPICLMNPTHNSDMGIHRGSTTIMAAPPSGV